MSAKRKYDCKHIWRFAGSDGFGKLRYMWCTQCGTLKLKDEDVSAPQYLRPEKTVMGPDNE